MSLRYQRLFQLEMGYGIPMAALEKLVRSVYHDDPAERFPCLGQGIRDALTMSRMQKAMAIIQFKLEAQTIERNPQWGLEHRRLLAQVNGEHGTIKLDGVVHPLADGRFPTVDWSDPTRLSPEEEECMAQLKTSFLQSQTLWEQMRYLERKGTMHLVRDYNLIFHGCVPVSESGEFLPMQVDGEPYRGKALFDALNLAVHRAFREQRPADLDLLWYLWCGPLSPLFGKDKIATFESYFIADKATHKEEKDPYFKLIHEKEFCRSILRDFGVDERTASSSTAMCRSRSSRANRRSRKAVRRSPSTARSRRCTATTGSRSCWMPTARTSRSTIISRASARRSRRARTSSRRSRT